MSEQKKDYRVMVLAMSTLPDPLKVDAFRNRYAFAEIAEIEVDGKKVKKIVRDETKKPYHGLGQMESVPQYILETGEITHFIILTTASTQSALSYDWEEINTEIKNNGDGACISYEQDEEISAETFFEKRIEAFHKKKGFAKPTFSTIDCNEFYPEEGLAACLTKIRELYQECHDAFPEETEKHWNLFFDVHGGFRDASFILFSMIHNLSAPDEQDLGAYNSNISSALARLTDGKGTIPVTGVYTLYFDPIDHKLNLFVDRTNLYQMFVRESFEAYMNYGQYASLALEPEVDPKAANVPSYAFISYRRLDAPKERFTLLGILKQNGYRYWYDDGIPFKSGWTDDLVTANKNSEVFIALITKNYFQSFQCVKELSQALDEKELDQIFFISTDGTGLYEPKDGELQLVNPDDAGEILKIDRKKLRFLLDKDNMLDLKSMMVNGVLDKSRLLKKLEQLCSKNPSFGAIRKS